MNQALYELPGKGRLLGGWQLNMLCNLKHRQLVHAGIQRRGACQREPLDLSPDLATGTIAMPRTQAQWFDRTAFVAPASGQWGNAGRGILEGPVTSSSAWAFRKRFTWSAWAPSP